MPANEARGERVLKLGDAEYTLKPTYGAFVLMEDKIGSLYQAALRIESTDYRIADVATPIWACLQENKSPPDYDTIATLIADEGLAKHGLLALEIMLLLYGGIKNAEKEPDTKKKAPKAGQPKS